MPTAYDKKLRVGISSCLLGERVRYDGGHKYDGFLAGTFGEWFDWVQVCPEVESGMGTPRPAMRLVKKGGETRVEEVVAKHDHTAQLQTFADTKAPALADEALCGFILKKGSPSCGMERVPIYNKAGDRSGFGAGVWAQTLAGAYPNLPIEEEGRLGDPVLRENWLGRVFLLARLRDLWKTKWGLKDIIEFHSQHKFLVLAHSPKAYSALGRLVAGAKKIPRGELKERYERELMEAAAVRATRGRHTNVLQHAIGYLRTHLDAESRKELESSVMSYRRGEIPLLVPLTLIRHHARTHKVTYLLGQIYLDPSRRELRTL